MVGVPELGTLRSELRDAGLFEHREVRSLVKIAGMFVALLATIVAIGTFRGWLAVLLVPLASVLTTSIAMFGHEGSHRSFSASAKRNAWLTYITFPMFSGLSALYWHNKHDRLHHGHPNVEGIDPDINPFPFASSMTEHLTKGKKERWFQRNLQRWVFWPMSTLMSVGMRRSSILYLWRYPREHGRTRQWAIELACVTVHYVMWAIVPMIVWGPLFGFVFFVSVWAGVGVLLALIFAPAHMGLPVVTQPNHDWLHQVETTRNLELPRVISFFFIGLDYQVEHHLFPKIPHQNLPAAARITRTWCAKQHLPYPSVPYLHALADSIRFMGTAWQRAAFDPAAIRAATLTPVEKTGPVTTLTLPTPASPAAQLQS